MVSGGFDPERDLKFSVDIQVKKLAKTGINTKPAQEEPEPEPEVEEIQYYNDNKVILFDMKPQFFESFLEDISENIKHELITDLKALTGSLKEKEKTYLFLNYTDNTNVAQQLIPQIKTKYSHVSIILIAKDLTINAVKQLSSKPYAAHEYLSFPCDQQEFLDLID